MIKTVKITYIVLKKLTDIVDFQQSLIQRQITVNVAHEAIADENVVIPDFSCQAHSCESIKMAIWASTNSLPNNYCKLKNDQILDMKKGKKRKLQTLEGPRNL